MGCLERNVREKECIIKEVYLMDKQISGTLTVRGRERDREKGNVEAMCGI